MIIQLIKEYLYLSDISLIRAGNYKDIKSFILYSGKQGDKIVIGKTRSEVIEKLTNQYIIK